MKLFIADGCGGQNKNKTMLVMVMKWFTSRPNLKSVELIFPVRGHSFIPPDRLFGHLEKNFRRKEVLMNPDEYIALMEGFTTIRRPGIDLEILDWKKEAEETFKPINKWHFKFAPCKRYVLKKSTRCKTNVLVRGEEFYYHELGSPHFLTKPKRDLGDVTPNVVKMRAHKVNGNKIADVERLLTIHYGAEWKAISGLKYYKDVLELCRPNLQANLNAEGEEEEVLCEPMEENIELSV